MTSNTSRLLSELRRRKLPRVAAAYIVAGAVVAGAANDILPNLGAPPWTVTLVIVLLLAGLPIALVLAWFFQVQPEGPPSSQPARSGSNGDQERTAGASPPESSVEASPPPRLSVAVLAFQNLSADPENEYFSDGMSEELLNTLARVPGLRVAARTSAFSFKGKDASIREIGRALNVAHVVEGSVRRVGNRVRITAQLIDAADGYHLWSESYDRDLSDILMVQREIAGSIGETLEAGLTRGWEDVLVTRGRADPAAVDHYLRARFCSQRLTRESLEHAIDHYREVLRIDPGFASALAGMANAYLWLGDAYLSPVETTPKAIDALNRAIELDPALAEARATRGYLRAAHEWCWEEGHREMEEALAQNPNLAEAHVIFGHVQIALNDRHGAVASAEKALELDPLSASSSLMAEWYYLFDGQLDAAIRQQRVTQELAPGMVYHDSVLGKALSEQGRFDEAIEAFEIAEKTLGRPSTGKGVALWGMGRKAQALALAGELEQIAERTYIMPELMGELYAVCGEKDRAIDWLRRGLEARSAGVVALLAWKLESLYDDPRFLDILMETGRSLS